MKEFIVTFGMNHLHNNGGDFLRWNTLGVLKADSYEEAILEAERLFGRYYSKVYDEGEWDDHYDKLFKGGRVEIKR